ncbi:MAG: hypothetical protein V4574_10640 [Pseudomonadota bacterium]
MPTFVNNGDHVFADPRIPGDGGSDLDAGMIVPSESRPLINGAPVTERSHEFIFEKKPDAPN